MHGSEMPEEQVHVLLPLEGALLLFAVVILHHEVRDGTEGPLSGEASPAHGDALEDPAHRAERHIVVPLKPEAVEVEGLLPDPAGAEAAAGLPIRL